MRQALAFLVCTLAAFACRSDPDEAWLVRAPLPGDIEPLLAVVVDTSVAMSQPTELDEPYDPLRDYGAALPADSRCDSESLYWRRGAGPAPDCTRQAGLALVSPDVGAGLHCEAARAPLAAHGYFVASRAAQWRADGRYWAALAAHSRETVECRADRGRHGASPGVVFATDGLGGPWSGDPADEIAWDRSPHGDPYVFYAGNFLNYLRAGPARVQRTLAEATLSALASALAATAELEVALVRVDPDGPAGGYVAQAPVANALAVAEVEALARETPSGAAPLGETLDETAAWLSGASVHFGTDDRADAAATEPAAPASYRSPFVHACRPVSLAIVTAGATSDGCGTDCLASAASRIELSDLSVALPGAQRATLAWVAPAIATLPAPSLDPADPLVFVNLVARSFQHDVAVPAPPQLSAAGVAPFVSEAHGPGVVFGLTAPATRERWAGNFFRYAFGPPDSPLAPPSVVDRDGEPAIDPGNGLPLPDSRSFWSDAPDSDLLAGGAAGRLPAPDARRIHTDLASDRVLDPDNRVAPDNTWLTAAIADVAGAESVSPETMLDWPASLRTLGDPGIHAPLVVDDMESGRQIVFAASHDGLLHAFDGASGVELWAWIPQELLPRIPSLMRSASSVVRGHGIDGSLILHRHDPDGDGHVETAEGEHAWLLFGLGRGGNHYYALDVSDVDDPRRLWSFELPGGDVDARADPLVTRLAIDGSGQSAGNWVVLLAGGYDRRFDSAQAMGEGRGNALHVVDARTGRPLWSAGGEDDDLRMPGLASLPSAARALDLDGDGYLDRAYVVDVTGALWRLEFYTGNSPEELAETRLVARLGTGPQRFYSEPDVSIIRTGAESHLAIAIGSGWQARPREPSIIDRMYTLFDHDTPRADALMETDLHDATSGEKAVPADASGWFVRLEQHGSGEKVVGRAVTFNHTLHFQTYQPLAPQDSEPCGPPRAMVRRYALDIGTGAPRVTVVESEQDEPDEDDLSGLPVDPRFGFPDRWEEPCPGCRPRPFGIVGAQTFDTSYAGDPVKTSWRKLKPPPASP